MARAGAAPRPRLQEAPAAVAQAGEIGNDHARPEGRPDLAGRPRQDLKVFLWRRETARRSQGVQVVEGPGVGDTVHDPDAHLLRYRAVPSVPGHGQVEPLASQDERIPLQCPAQSRGLLGQLGPIAHPRDLAPEFPRGGRSAHEEREGKVVRQRSVERKSPGPWHRHADVRFAQGIEDRVEAEQRRSLFRPVAKEGAPGDKPAVVLDRACPCEEEARFLRASLAQRPRPQVIQPVEELAAMFFVIAVIARVKEQVHAEAPALWVTVNLPCRGAGSLKG